MRIRKCPLCMRTFPAGLNRCPRCGCSLKSIEKYGSKLSNASSAGKASSSNYAIESKKSLGIHEEFQKSKFCVPEWAFGDDWDSSTSCHSMKLVVGSRWLSESNKGYELVKHYAPCSAFISRSLARCEHLQTVDEIMFNLLGRGLSLSETLIGTSVMVKENEPASCLFQALRDAFGLESRNAVSFRNAKGINLKNVAAIDSGIHFVECQIEQEWVQTIVMCLKEEESGRLIQHRIGGIRVGNDHCAALKPGSYNIRRPQTTSALPTNVALTEHERRRVLRAVEGPKVECSNWMKIDPRISICLDEKGISVRQSVSRTRRLVQMMEQVINYNKEESVNLEQLVNGKEEMRFTKLSDIPRCAAHGSEVREILHYYLVVAALLGRPAHKRSKYSCLLDALCPSNEEFGIEVDYPICDRILQKLCISITKAVAERRTFTHMPDGCTVFMNAVVDEGKIHVTPILCHNLPEVQPLAKEFVLGAK